MPDECWSPGCCSRDTLVYELGTLADVLMRGANDDARVRRTYAFWVQQFETEQLAFDATTELVDVTLQGGRATLLARSRLDEFCLVCKHPNFESIIVFSYVADRQRVEGIWVATFDGAVGTAIHFARNMAAQVRRRKVEPAAEMPMLH